MNSKSKLIDKFKYTIKRTLRRTSDQRHRIAAEALLKSIELEKGKLSRELKKRSREYAQDILGSTVFAPWLNVYSAIAGKFKEGWIPDNYYGSIVVPKLKGLYGGISKAKPLSSKLLSTDRLPDIAYYVNGLFFATSEHNSTWTVLMPENVERYLFACEERVVFKIDNSSQGKGIYVFTRKAFDIGMIYKLGNGVFQKYINQHDFFEEIMPNSVASIRLTSVVEDGGKVSCRTAYLRLGRSEDSHIKSSSAVKVPVDLASGQLQEKGYLVNWHSVVCHPDTHVVFGGKVIPKFNECVEYILETHLTKVPYCRSIGWDITVDRNEEIQLIEWNGAHNDIKFSEATQGPCFADMGWEKLREAQR